MSPEIRIDGPEALPAFIALAEDAAVWLWARGIRQWKPGSIRAAEAELLGKLDQGWLITTMAEGEMVAGCLLTRLAPPEWLDKTTGAAYIERLTVSRTYAGQGLGRSIVGACADLGYQEGLGALRLDCWAGNETLKALYRGLGFRDVAEVASDGYQVCLFEMNLAGTHQG